MISDFEQATICYVTEYSARRIQKSPKCNASCYLFCSGEAVQISLEHGSVSKEKLEAKEEFFSTNEQRSAEANIYCVHHMHPCFTVVQCTATKRTFDEH